MGILIKQPCMSIPCSSGSVHSNTMSTGIPAPSYQPWHRYPCKSTADLGFCTAGSCRHPTRKESSNSCANSSTTISTADCSAGFWKSFSPLSSPSAEEISNCPALPLSGCSRSTDWQHCSPRSAVSCGTETFSSAVLSTPD